MQSDRWSAQLQLEHLQQKYMGAGTADTTKWDWGTDIRRDSLASHLGHHSRLLYMAVAENESLARVRQDMLWKMTCPCGAPPPKKKLEPMTEEQVETYKKRKLQ